MPEIGRSRSQPRRKVGENRRMAGSGGQRPDTAKNRPQSPGEGIPNREGEIRSETAGGPRGSPSTRIRPRVDRSRRGAARAPPKPAAPPSRRAAEPTSENLGQRAGRRAPTLTHPYAPATTGGKRRPCPNSAASCRKSPASSACPTARSSATSRSSGRPATKPRDRRPQRPPPREG